ncbi:MAG: urea transport system substrate-binding protein [Solirubrobacteraceae bacterium]|nr:urea transport system substrate-binding protein [Solirubrobacteraceae bacterium]
MQRGDSQLPAQRDSDADAIEVALLIPLHGSAGIYGPSCELCAQLATEEVNAESGVLGRPLRLRIVDASGAPGRVARDVYALIAHGEVDAVVGWHISAIRNAVAPRIAGRVPYVYTALYEGGEDHPGVFLVGETPSRQLLPAMQWLRAEAGARRWCVVGNDYSWPLGTAAAARLYAPLCDGRICDEVFVPLGSTHFDEVVRRIERHGADAVLMLLVGQDAVEFNRAFAHAGLDESCRRLSTLIEENTLLASGAESTRGICAAAAYFESLVTPESLEFGSRYARRFGADAPTLNSPAESCYEGILLLAALARAAHSLDVPALCRVADSVRYAGPRGELSMHGQHLDQRVYLAEADALDLDVVAQL